MANLAKIQSIAQWQFFVKDSLGNLTELKVGDTVYILLRNMETMIMLYI